jgi:4-amino-4-deoxy-L-arabinose transferase-like glycosyltransferase
MLMARARRDWVEVMALVALAAALLLPNLGSVYLWQDEAQTATISKTILEGGIPRGTDGKNFFSQEIGKEYGPDHVWKWHTWLSFYITAGSFAVLGETTTAARLPFALLGIATVVLAYFMGWALWRDRHLAIIGAGLLATSVPFLIFSRQCRYYAAVSFLSMLGIYAYTRLKSGQPAAAWWMFAAATLVFHTHFIYCGTLLVTLALHAMLFDRSKLRTVAAVICGTIVVNAPWIFWFSDIRPGGDSYLSTVFDLAKLSRYSLGYFDLILQWLFRPWWLIIPGLLVAWRWRRGEALWVVSRETSNGVALMIIYAVVSVVMISALSPLVFYRYLAPLCVPAMLIAGLLLGNLAKRSILLSAVIGVVWLYTGTVRDHVFELTHAFEGPIGGIVRFLDENAKPDDVVAISYGDLPLKFYTDLRIIGGLTGEDLRPAETADWVIIRRHTNTDEDRRVKQELRRIVTSADYRMHRIAAPDTQYENRETPRLHRFRTAPRESPRVVIFERRS